MKKEKRLISILLGCCLLFVGGNVTLAQENIQVKEVVPAKTYENYIYYHCADWGPNEDGTDELIYFVKQIVFYESDAYSDTSTGNEIYWCSMKPDGSEKKEIVKLFENTESILDINGGNTNIDICWETKKAAIALAAGPTEAVGIWTINLDGTDFKRIVEMEGTKDLMFRVNHPSWFLDGKRLVYHEKWLKPRFNKEFQYHIVSVDSDGSNKKYLTEVDNEKGVFDRYPAVSPDGKKIAYTHFWWNFNPKPGQKLGGRNLWIMDADGSNKKLLFDNKYHYADYPEWSPDGSQIYTAMLGEFVLLDSKTGEIVFSKWGGTGKIHWSDKYGYILDGHGFVSILSKDLAGHTQRTQKHKSIGKGGYIKIETKEDKNNFLARWGIEK